MIKKMITAMAKRIRPLRKAIEGRVNEWKFEQRVSQALQNPAFDKSKNITRFEYEGTQVAVQVPDPRDFISLTIISTNNFFDVHDLEALRDKVPAGGVVIDAGSNIGNHALYYAKVCKAAAVYCFEPQEKIFSVLRENIALNKLEEVVTPYKLALGDQVARANPDFQDDIVVSGKQSQVNYGGLFLKESDQGIFEITTLDIKLLPQLTRLDFIKLDVQGFETKVLNGARELLTKFKPGVQVECMDKKILNAEIIPLMNSLGYRIGRVLEIDYFFEPVK